MGLRDLVIPTALVTLSSDSGFTVRGLSPNDALGLYYRHAGELSALYDKFAGQVRGGAEILSGDILQAGVGIVSGTPRVMAEIIVLACDISPSDADWDLWVANVLRFPAGVQMDALQKIATLTFSSDMPPGKFLGLVLEMARSAQAALANQKG
jgi:hypothetical protein